MSVPRIKINYVYEHYNLYKILYGSTFDVRAFEATGAVMAAELLHSTYLRNSKLSVLELFGGHSEHRDLFFMENRVPLEDYHCLEIQKHAKGSKPWVKMGDARKQFPGDYNLILAFYYSLNSTMAEDGAIKRSALVRYFENIRKNLERVGGGGHYFHMGGPNTLQSTLEGLYDDTEKRSYFVHPHHPIRKEFGLDPYEDVELKTLESCTFNRLTNTRRDYYTSIKLVAGKKPVANFQVKEPFLLRDWTEPELTDIVQDAGFDTVHYFSHVKDDGMGEATRTVLPHEYTNESAPEDANEAREALATDMMVVVPPPKKRKGK